MMKRHVVIFFVMLCCLSSFAQERISHTFRDVSLSEALRYIDKKCKKTKIFFIYDDLEHLKASATLKNASPSEAVKSVIGTLPVKVSEVGSYIYVEYRKPKVERVKVPVATGETKDIELEEVVVNGLWNVDSMFICDLPFQEKVYMSFDNRFYFLGDTIWYKAFVCRADNNRPSALSRVLYTELVDEQGYIQQRQTLRVDSVGQAHGQFVIPDSAWAGCYEIRAYTKWMMNFGYDTEWNTQNQSYLEEVASGSGRFANRQYYNLFSRVIPVYSNPALEPRDHADREKVLQVLNRRVIPVKNTMGDYEVRYTYDKFNVSFFPEGGNLVYDHTSRVAFEVMNEQTQRLNINGLLLEDGIVIDSIHYVYGGRGDFSLTPRRGHKYYALFTYDGKEYKKALPTPASKGCVMCANYDGRLHVDVESEGVDTSAVYLSVICRGVLSVKEKLIFKGEKSSLTISPKLLTSGVNQLTVFDAQGHIFSDRLIFIDKGDILKADIRIDGRQSGLLPLQKDSIVLTLSSRGRKIENTTFSVSVRDKGQNDDSFYRGNIMTELLLQSDLKGYIENADYYLKDIRALDLLMLVQGWRRYKWEDVAYAHKFEPEFDYEKSLNVKGETFDIRRNIFYRNKGLKRISATLMLNETSITDHATGEEIWLFRGSCLTDPHGRFDIQYTPYFGDATLQLTALYNNKLHKRKYTNRHHDSNIFIKREWFFPLNVKELSWYEINKPDFWIDTNLSEEERQHFDIYSSELLPNVNISKRKRNYQRQLNKPIISYDVLDLCNDFWDLGFYDHTYKYDGININTDFLIFTARSIVEGNYKRFRNDNVKALINSNLYNIYTSYKNNGEPFELYRPRSLTRLDKIDIISDVPRRKSWFQHISTHYSPSVNTGAQTTTTTYINLKTFPDDEEHRFIVGRYIRLPGFSTPAEFYHPRYNIEGIDPHLMADFFRDYRKTIYWNPSVTTDENGVAKVFFYNNSICRDIEVEIEGITADGVFISK